jgi:hypothetical protein
VGSGDQFLHRQIDESVHVGWAATAAARGARRAAAPRFGQAATSTCRRGTLERPWLVRCGSLRIPPRPPRPVRTPPPPDAPCHRSATRADRARRPRQRQPEPRRRSHAAPALGSAADRTPPGALARPRQSSRHRCGRNGGGSRCGTGPMPSTTGRRQRPAPEPTPRLLSPSTRTRCCLRAAGQPAVTGAIVLPDAGVATDTRQA